MTRHTTDRRADLLAAVRQYGGEWCNRTQLAQDTGKTRLSPNDVHHLDALQREGLIEAQQVAIHSPLGFEWQYRAK